MYVLCAGHTRMCAVLCCAVKDDDIDQLENWYRDYYRTTNVKCFLSCNNSEWFQNDMKRFLENKLKQNRSRPLSKVAELTPMHEANSVM